MVTIAAARLKSSVNNANIVDYLGNVMDKLQS